MTRWNQQPIGEARLNRALRNHALDTHNAQALRQLAAETGGNLQAEKHKILARGLGDLRALRGIPAIGRGVQGAPPHWRPGNGL